MTKSVKTPRGFDWQVEEDADSWCTLDLPETTEDVSVTRGAVRWWDIEEAVNLPLMAAWMWAWWAALMGLIRGSE